MTTSTEPEKAEIRKLMTSRLRFSSTLNLAAWTTAFIESDGEAAIDWLDRNTRNRLTPLFRRPLIYLPQMLCLLTGLMMPFLEVIPFSASIAASGVFLLSMSLLTRDGLFFLLALAPYSAFALLIVEGVPA